MIKFEDIKDEPLYKVLMKIRKAPEVWLKRKSLKLLDVYITGFLFGKSNAKKPTYYPKWYGEFTKYVLNALVDGDNHYDIIYAIYGSGYDDENGLNMYFQLLDDFCMEKCLDKEPECLPSEPEGPAEKEIRAAEIGRDAIFGLAIKYIFDNFNEIFDLEEEEGFVSTRVYECLRGVDSKCLQIIAYDTKYCKVSVEKLIKNVDISAETLLCDKPYTVIKIPQEGRQ